MKIRSLRSHRSQWHSAQSDLLNAMRLTLFWNGLSLKVHWSYFYEDFCSGMTFWYFFHWQKCYARTFFSHLKAQIFPKLIQKDGLIHSEIQTFPHWPRQAFKFKADHIRSNWFRSKIWSRDFESFERLLFWYGLISASFTSNDACNFRWRFSWKKWQKCPENLDLY